MVLGDVNIHQFVSDGIIGISPFSTKQLNPNSYDLRIGDFLQTYTKGYHQRGEILDCKRDNVTVNWNMTKDGFILRPGIIHLANTVEYIDLTPKEGYPYICATLMGKSSLGRLGLDVHISAGFIDTGFKGQIVLELRVEQPLRIYSNMPIAQIKFEMSTPVENHYGNKSNSKYQDQEGIVPSKMYLNFQ